MIRDLTIIAIIVLMLFVAPAGRMAASLGTFQVNLGVKRIAVITPGDTGKVSGCIDKSIPETLVPGVWLLETECTVTFEEKSDAAV